MKILITGAAGFVGKNLTAALQNIKDGKDRTHPSVTLDELYLYDIDSSTELLEEACKNCDFVFNLAGVNRPQNPEEFMQGNFGFASTLLNTLKKYKNNMLVTLNDCMDELSSLIEQMDEEKVKQRLKNKYNVFKRKIEKIDFDNLEENMKESINYLIEEIKELINQTYKQLEN